MRQSTLAARQPSSTLHVVVRCPCHVHTGDPGMDDLKTGCVELYIGSVSTSFLTTAGGPWRAGASMSSVLRMSASSSTLAPAVDSSYAGCAGRATQGELCHSSL